jgi:ATP-dependent helicase HepA
MSLTVVGQRCLSEREPELGLGLVAALEHGRITVEFPATRERRIYARGTTVLKRVVFNVGDSLTTRDGTTFAIETVTEENGLQVYAGGGQRAREDAVSDITSVSSPAERLLAGQADPSEVFDLRLRTLRARTRFRQSAVRGFLGGRIDLIPHQFYILQEVARRQIPRVLLADEVGLGKTIEACLILQRLLATGRASRALILVPESLTHQWFVELLRRFNLWFTIFDEARCTAVEESDPGKNPFLSSQLALASVTWLAGSDSSEVGSARRADRAEPGAPDLSDLKSQISPPPAPSGGRRAQAIEAGWDMVIVDEAHHLGWTPEAASPEYTLVEQLAVKSPGLLLLTATPTQLGLAGHFARLRLLDPNRYADYDRFVAEQARFGAVAGVAEKIVEKKALTAKDHATLKEIFDRDPAGLQAHLDALAAAQPGAREKLLRTLLDQHGTGRVVFRNTRAAMTGFPPRRYCPVPLPGASPTLLTRVARELEAEETGAAAGIRYAFREDPRLDWLVGFLQETAPAKVLLICRSERKLLALESALKERTNLKVGLFHESLPLVQRDRQAAWFAEPDGAQLLLCSEIGSEGRNFQFAHHLVLFDLPLNPGLVEQRIGRLDRIGQTEPIRIHVPYLIGSADEVVATWYHLGLDAFASPVHSGNEYAEAFRERLLILATAHGLGVGSARRADRDEPSAPDDPGRRGASALPAATSPSPAERTISDLKSQISDLNSPSAALIAETAKFRAALAQKLKRGRDRLLELNSFDAPAAAAVLDRVRAADADPLLRQVLSDLLDHFGVRVKDHEDGELFLDADHAYVEGFPSIPRDGMLATYDRRRAIAREDIRFLSADHPLVQDTIDLLVDSPTGTTAFCVLEGDQPNVLLEAVFVLEPLADARWHVDQFLAPTPVRVLVDVHGRDLTDDPARARLAEDLEDSPLPRFLQRPGFNATLLKNLVSGAADRAEVLARGLKQAARTLAATTLTEELQRLVDLAKVNDHVRPEEIDLARKRVLQTRTAIEQARLRLDSLRLIVEGVDAD